MTSHASPCQPLLNSHSELQISYQIRRSMKRTKVKGSAKAASKAMIAVEEDIFAEGITAPAKTESHTEVRGEEDDSNEDDESPEMVSSSHDDIKKLREMHEQMMLPAEKRNKKKKVRSISEINAVKKASEDEELDESILEVLGDLNEAKDSTGNNNNNDERLQAEEFKRMSRTLSKKKRKGLINAHARKSRKM